jgi:hypothetical protein
VSADRTDAPRKLDQIAVRERRVLEARRRERELLLQAARDGWGVTLRVMLLQVCRPRTLAALALIGSGSGAALLRSLG